MKKRDNNYYNGQFSCHRLKLKTWHCASTEQRELLCPIAFAIRKNATKNAANPFDFLIFIPFSQSLLFVILASAFLATPKFLSSRIWGHMRAVRSGLRSTSYGIYTLLRWGAPPQ